MNPKQPQATPAAASVSGGTAGGTAASSAATTTNPNDPAALLLAILRNVDREVRSTLELDDDAQKVVGRFRSIDRALRVRPVAAGSLSTGTPLAAPVAAAATR